MQAANDCPANGGHCPVALDLECALLSVRETVLKVGIEEDKIRRAGIALRIVATIDQILYGI